MDKQQEKLARNLASDIQSQLKYFERSVQEWADIIKVLAKINDILNAYPPKTKFNCFSEFIQRIGQCLSPSLPQGVHLSVLDIYMSLLQLMGDDVHIYVDELFIPLLPLYPHAAIPVRRQFLLLIKKLIERNLDKKYTGPLVACLLSCQPSDPAEQEAVSKMLDFFHTKDSTFFIKQQFQLLNFPCAARRNVLQQLLNLIKRYLESGTDLAAFDGNEDQLVPILHSETAAEVALALDILQILYPVPEHFDNTLFRLFTCLFTHALQIINSEQSIQSRAENWILSATPTTRARLIYHSLVTLLADHKTLDLFKTVERREELLDPFLAAFPLLLESGEKGLLEFLQNENFVKLYAYRSLCLYLLFGKINITILEDDGVTDILTTGDGSGLQVTRIPLTLDEKVDAITRFFAIQQALPKLRGFKVCAQKNENTIDLFGGRVFKNDEDGSVVIAELCGIVLDTYLQSKDNVCIDFVLALLQKADIPTIIKVLQQKHTEENDILTCLDKSVYQKLCEHIVADNSFVESNRFMLFMQLFAQNSVEPIQNQPWFWKILVRSVGGQFIQKDEFQSVMIELKQQQLDSEYNENKKLAIEFIHSMLSDKSVIQTQVIHFLAQHQDYLELLIAQLFEQVSELDTTTALWLCKFCALETPILLQKLEILIAKKLTMENQQMLTVQKFICLWQVMAENFKFQLLFKRLTMLHVDMASRQDISDATKQVLHQFIKRVFSINLWASELIDNLLDQSGAPQIIKKDQHYHIAKKTATTYVVDIYKVSYIFNLFNTLIKANREFFLLSLVQTPISHNSKCFLDKIPFYKADYIQENYLDLLVDFSICFLIVNEPLPQKLMLMVTEFLNEIFLEFKQSLTKYAILVIKLVQITDRISNILFSSIRLQPQNGYMQEVLRQILDTMAQYLIANKTQQQQIRVEHESLIRIPNIFVELLKKDFLNPFFRSLEHKSSHTISFLISTIDILFSLQVELSVTDVHQYLLTWIDINEPKLKNINVTNKLLPTEILDSLSVEDLYQETEKKASIVQQRLQQNACTCIQIGSFLPAQYRFYPAQFLAIMSLQNVIENMTQLQDVSIDYKYLVASLIFKCSNAIFNSAQNQQILIPESIIENNQVVNVLLLLQQDKQFYNKLIVDTGYTTKYDRQSSFLIPQVTKFIVSIFETIDANTHSITKQIVMLLQASLNKMCAYNQLIFYLTLIQIDSTHLYPYGILAATQVLSPQFGTHCMLRVFAQLNAVLTQNSKQIQLENRNLSLSQLNLYCSQAYAQSHVYMRLVQFANLTSTLRFAIQRAAFSNNDSVRSLVALVQFHHSPFVSYTGDFSKFSTSEDFAAKDELIKLGIEFIAQQLCLIQLLLTKDEVEMFHSLPDDYLIVKRFISLLTKSVFYLADERSDILTPQLCDLIFESTIRLGHILAGDTALKFYPYDLSEHGLRLMSSGVIQHFSLVDDRQIQQRPSNDLVHIQGAVQHLVNLIRKLPAVRSRSFVVLNLLLRLDLKLRKQLFGSTVMQILSQVKQYEVAEFCQLAKFMQVESVSNTLEEMKLRRNRQVTRALLLAFTVDEQAAEFESLIQLLCQQTRQPDSDFELVLLTLDALMLTQPKHIIDPFWTTAVQFITIGQKRHVRGAGVAAWLLGMKCPDKQYYVCGFLGQEVVENIVFWIVTELMQKLE